MLQMSGAYHYITLANLTSEGKGGRNFVKQNSSFWNIFLHFFYTPLNVMHFIFI